MACPKQVKTRIAAALLLALLLPFPAARAISEAPTASELLSLVRLNETAQNHDFNGRLQVNGETKIVIPFRLSMRGSTIIYQLTTPPEAFVLHLVENGARLNRVIGSGKTEKITDVKLADLVRGADISYEDLSLKFLYWNNANVEKEQEHLMTRTCWIVRAVPSRKDESQYDMARLWIEPTGGLRLVLEPIAQLIGELHVRPHRLGSTMDFQNIFAVLTIREIDRDATIESSRTKQRGIKHIRAIRCRHNNDALVRFKAVHFHEDLVECLLALVVATAHSRAAYASYGVLQALCAVAKCSSIATAN